MTYAFDAELASLIVQLPDVTLDISDPRKARSALTQTMNTLNRDLDCSDVVFEDRCIPGSDGSQRLTVRLYSPENLSGDVPGLLYIHGGGFVMGDLDSEHGTCLTLCRSLGVVLVSVDYRLAPETPYPGALEDCYTALVWVAAHASDLRIDAARLGVFGRSAGAGLAAAVCLLSRDRDGPQPCFQYLGIPELDDRLDTASMCEFVDTPIWHRPNAQLSWDYYLGDNYCRGADDVPYHAAPARAEDLSGLPPAYINTMEFDPLRDEGVLYALALMQAGVPTELHSFPGTFHGSILFTQARMSQLETDEMKSVLRRGLRIGAPN
jgi:acetyl esterase/lipase